MKNLFTLLLLVVSILAVGQTNNTSEEIKYWKSIADSNDTVAYQEYLQRYGENGLYKDEAITRITLLKSSGKQAHQKSVECCFYSRYTDPKSVECIVRFGEDNSKVWFRHIDYDTLRSNLAVSSDFYENQLVVPIMRSHISNHITDIIGKVTDSNNNVLSGATILATTWWGSMYHSKTDANGNYCLALPYSSVYQIEFRMAGFPSYATSTRGKSQILNVLMNKESSSLCQVLFEAIQFNGNVWTKDEEYQYNSMKSTSARDVYFKRDVLNEIQYKGDKRYIKKTFYEYSDSPFLNELLNDKLDKKVYDYKYEFEIITMQGYRYIAFSKDKSSFIMWFEEDDNLDGQIFEKRNYYRVSKEELLPKAVNYDFLNN